MMHVLRLNVFRIMLLIFISSFRDAEARDDSGKYFG